MFLAQLRSAVLGFLVVACVGVPRTWAQDLSMSDIANSVLKAIPDSTGWEVVHADENPSVDMGTAKGYRILLRYGRKEPVEHTQRAIPQEELERGTVKSIMKYSHIDLLLFPAKSILPKDVLARVPWKSVEQEHFVRPVYWGDGLGFKWYARSEIVWHYMLPERIKLSGGDNRLRILAEGLTVQDDGAHTANTSVGLLRQAGEKALPYVQEVVEKSEGDDPWYPVLGLSGIQGSKATDLLCSLYHSNDQRVSDAAAYALIHKPYREAAKQEYLDMLRHQRYVSEIGETSIQYGWKDAVGILKEICSGPSSWRVFRSAFEAERQLLGKPIPQDIKDAENQLKASVPSLVPNAVSTADPRLIEEAKSVILNSADKESAVVIAVSLAFWADKADTKPVNDIGKDIFWSLPAETRESLLAILQRIPDEGDRYRLAYLTERI